MKRIALYVFLIMFVVTGYAMAEGQRHHPDRFRYGYVPLPLTSFVRDTGSIIPASTSPEGTVSPAEAVLNTIDGNPALVLGWNAGDIVTQFRLPTNYWRDGKIEVLASNNIGDGVQTGLNLGWSLRISSDTSIDTTGDLEAVVSASEGATETLEFIPATAGAAETLEEGSHVTFTVGRTNFAATSSRDGVMRFYDFVFKYEKKTDS